jgi:16S rRNA (guanine966-N2)-methyltransferase
MRIITGKLKGRDFTTPRSFKVHPMGDRQKSAVFNILGDLTGLTVFDAYGGTGALAFESISRGASSALIIELDKNAHRAIAENIEKLGIDEQARAIQGNCIGWSKRNHDQQFDVVFADPPYDAVLLRDIEQLGTHVKPGGMLVLSWPVHLGAEPLPGFEVLRDRTYARARLVFYRK